MVAWTVDVRDRREGRVTAALGAGEAGDDGAAWAAALDVVERRAWEQPRPSQLWIRVGEKEGFVIPGEDESGAPDAVGLTLAVERMRETLTGE
ncbi:hypothetical protein [Pseudonocardia sp. D17]|uniref:hypothetical protein n=1 Tax=Pseudonocardia sp. D17 TaxID=882661 RepID=UPI002B38036B|nr:hypothetical protein PSD17_10060 [Pseudonocardia sp. D17]